MTKNTTLNLRVDPIVKQQAEDVLNKLGITMSTAINMYLRKIYLTQGIPFTMELPIFPIDINSDEMSSLELNEKLLSGYKDFKAGNVNKADEVFNDFRKKHKL